MNVNKQNNNCFSIVDLCVRLVFVDLNKENRLMNDDSSKEMF